MKTENTKQLSYQEHLKKACERGQISRKEYEAYKKPSKATRSKYDTLNYYKQ